MAVVTSLRGSNRADPEFASSLIVWGLLNLVGEGECWQDDVEMPCVPELMFYMGFVKAVSFSLCICVTPICRNYSSYCDDIKIIEYKVTTSACVSCEFYW